MSMSKIMCNNQNVLASTHFVNVYKNAIRLRAVSGGDSSVHLVGEHRRRLPRDAAHARHVQATHRPARVRPSDQAALR